MRAKHFVAIGVPLIVNGGSRFPFLYPHSRGISPPSEKAGLVSYAIFVHGTGAEQENPDVSMAGYAIIEINVEKNPLLEKFNEVNNDVKTNIIEIPEWIKNNAGWWAEGIIDDEAFVNGIQYLIEHGIIQT